MKRKVKLPFDPKVFLSKVNGGRAIHDYRKDKIVFRQGEPADGVLYIQWSAPLAVDRLEVGN